MKKISSFEIQQVDGKYKWVLWTGNGRPIALSANEYGTLNDCKQSIRNLLDIMKTPEHLAMRVSSGFLKSRSEPSKPSKNDQDHSPVNERSTST